MQKYLKRQVYDDLLAWKKQEDRATLEVSGARQVGKTYIVNKFADEQYANKIYINLLDFSGELFWSIMKIYEKRLKMDIHVKIPYMN